MGYSKRQIIQNAYDEIGLGTYAFDLSPEQEERAARRLDAMMAEWSGRGIVLSFPVPSEPENTNVDSDAGVPDWANEAVILGLAIKLAPSEGKSLSQDTRVSFANAFNTVAARCVRNVDMQLPQGTPAGAGNRLWPYGTTFLPAPVATEETVPEKSVTFAK